MIIVFFSKFIVVHSILIRNICLIKILLMNEPIYNFSIWLFFVIVVISSLSVSQNKGFLT